MKELLESFRRTAQLALLFVRNVCRVEVFVMEEGGLASQVAVVTAPGPLSASGPSVSVGTQGEGALPNSPASASASVSVVAPYCVQLFCVVMWILGGYYGRFTMCQTACVVACLLAQRSAKAMISQ